VQALTDRHDTLCKKVLVAPAGLEAAWTLQTVPFHTSTNGAVAPELFR
jgi:hypothetical protein